MAMETFKSIVDSSPFIKNLAQKLNIDPVYIFLFFLILSLVMIQKTSLSGFFSCVLSMYFPVREAILSIQSPAPKASEQRKLLIVFVFYTLFTLLESLGIRSIIPLFTLGKISFMFWLSYDEKHANLICDSTLKKIPQNILHCGDTIESAVKKAAKSVSTRVDIKNGTAEIKTE